MSWSVDEAREGVGEIALGIDRAEGARVKEFVDDWIRAESTIKYVVRRVGKGIRLICDPEKPILQAAIEATPVRTAGR